MRPKKPRPQQKERERDKERLRKWTPTCFRMNKLSQSGVEVIDPILYVAKNPPELNKYSGFPLLQKIGLLQPLLVGRKWETCSKIHEDLLNVYNSIDCFVCLFCVLFCFVLNLFPLDQPELQRWSSKTWVLLCQKNSTFLPHPFPLQSPKPLLVSLCLCICTTLSIQGSSCQGFDKHPLCYCALQPCGGVSQSTIFAILQMRTLRTKKYNDLCCSKWQSSKNPGLSTPSLRLSSSSSQWISEINSMSNQICAHTW